VTSDVAACRSSVIVILQRGTGLPARSRTTRKRRASRFCRWRLPGALARNDRKSRKFALSSHSPAFTLALPAANVSAIGEGAGAAPARAMPVATAGSSGAVAVATA